MLQRTTLRHVSRSDKADRRTAAGKRRFPWRLALLLPVVLLRPAAAADAPIGPSGKAVDYAIVVTGGELLEGAYADGHTHFLTRTLRPLGLRCAGSMCVDDKPDELKEALRFAGGRASLVIVTGGLGPTDNDITRATLSEYTRIPLREHPDVLRAMARRFGTSPEGIRPNLRLQTQVPTRGGYLKNPHGSAVGLIFQPAGAAIVALPGPPRELQAMVRDELVPYLSRRFGTRLPGCSLRLRFVGLGQSQIDQTLEQHVPLPAELTLSSQFDGSRVDFTFSLPSDTPQDRRRLQQLKAEILKHLGDHVYGEGQTSLEQCVVTLLQDRGQTLALAEAGSGGSLAAGLSNTDAADRVLTGAYVAPTEEKLRRLLHVPDGEWTQTTAGAERAKLLASAVSEQTGSQWAIAVGRPQPAPDGRRQVQVVLRHPDGRLEPRQVPLGSRSRLITRLLDRLRRELSHASRANPP